MKVIFVASEKWWRRKLTLEIYMRNNNYTIFVNFELAACLISWAAVAQAGMCAPSWLPSWCAIRNSPSSYNQAQPSWLTISERGESRLSAGLWLAAASFFLEAGLKLPFAYSSACNLPHRRRQSDAVASSARREKHHEKQVNQG